MKFRWFELLLSLFLAVGLWYGVSGSEKVETQVEIRVDYKGIPEGLVVRSGIVNKVSVRIRAAVGTLRTTTTGRDYPLYVDLSSVQKGQNTVPIETGKLPLWGAIEIIDVTPSRLILDVDSVESKTVPLVADIQGELAPDHIVQVSFNPAEVRITGASELLELLDSVAIAVPVNPSMVQGNTESRRRIVLPDGVEAHTADAAVGVHIGVKRKLVTVTRRVQVSVPEYMGSFLRPDSVAITVAVPESTASQAAGNKDINAYVTPEEFKLGTYTLPVHVRVPEGAEFVKVEPANVTLTLEQKH